MPAVAIPGQDGTPGIVEAQKTRRSDGGFEQETAFQDEGSAA